MRDDGERGDCPERHQLRLEVRCCCQPQKLLGWLPAPDDVQIGQVIRFQVRPARWVFARKSSVPDATPQYEPVDTIALPVASLGAGYLNGEPITRLAFKSEETPIERLRLIPGFAEEET